MSYYRVKLENYVSDQFRLPVLCGGRQFVFDFSWDTIHQRTYDNINHIIDISGRFMTLTTLSDGSIMQRGTDFFDYVDAVGGFRNNVLSFLGYWIPILEDAGSIPDWTQYHLDLDSLVVELNELYISTEKINKANTLKLELENIQSLADDKGILLAAFASLDEEFLDYIAEKEAWKEAAIEQLDELEELLRWAIKVTHEQQIKLTMLEPGAVHFVQDPVYRVLFESPKDKIGRRDLEFVTMWIEVRDAFNS